MGSDHHKFSDNYMILRPEEVSLCDLFGILTNRDIAEKAFVEIPTGGAENLDYRWFMFISLLVQKLLQFFSKPLSKLGLTFEKWLNISSNCNLGLLLLRVLLGKEAVPQITQDKSLSFIGHLDRRVELDENIKPGDSGYYALLCAMASKLSYENEAVVKNTVENCWKMELLGYYDFWNDFQRKATTQGFMFYDATKDSDTIIIAFRGTEFFDADAWCTDIDISWYEFPGIGKIHGGFMKALGLVISEGFPKEIERNSENPLAYYTLRDQLREIIQQNSKRKFIVTGHSLGGALAILFVTVLALHNETCLLQRLEGVYTFGQPRVGDEVFKLFMEKILRYYRIKYLRFVYCNDVITRLPRDDSTFLFKHFGTCLYYNSCYQGKIVEEEPDKNYILLLGGIPRFFNAWWELLRSFILPYKCGPDFAETNLLKFARLFGLLLPGLADHNLQDYINLIRLGSPDDIIAQACRKINREESSSFGKAYDQI